VVRRDVSAARGNRGLVSRPINVKPMERLFFRDRRVPGDVGARITSRKENIVGPDPSIPTTFEARLRHCTNDRFMERAQSEWFLIVATSVFRAESLAPIRNARPSQPDDVAPRSDRPCWRIRRPTARVSPDFK